MKIRWGQFSIILSFSILTFAVVLYTQKPLCIDSKVVERIDRVFGKNQETLYKCSVRHSAPFSGFFVENILSLNRRVAAVEKFLEGIAPYKNHIQLIISEDRPWLYRIENQKIFIGTKMLSAEGHLERALIKSWIQDYRHSKIQLADEVLADFILFASTGRVQLIDDRNGYKTKLNGSTWPQVVKSSDTYCFSPWKLSEHYETCDTQNKVDTEIAAIYSSRPLLSSALIESYQNLSLLEKYNIIKQFNKLIIPSEIYEQTAAQQAQINELNQLFEEKNLLKIASEQTRMTVYQLGYLSETLKNKMTQELLKSGYSDSKVEIPFDFLFIVQSKVDLQSPEFSQLYELANHDKKIKIAIKDSQGIWIMPAKSPIVTQSLESVKANRTILEQCGDFTFEYVMDYENLTNKLFVVDACVKKTKNYAAYIYEGVEGFARNNKGIDFIQFHIPSLAMKKSQISRAEKVIAMIQKRDILSPTFQSLGWQELKWYDNIHAYHPTAYVDAIEWFRVQ